jgi:hypothetical protein
LQQFWADACYINEAGKAEHSLVIQSMYHQYRNAARCYVYLPNVSASLLLVEKEVNSPLWDSVFQHYNRLSKPVGIALFSIWRQKQLRHRQY